MLKKFNLMKPRQVENLRMQVQCIETVLSDKSKVTDNTDFLTEVKKAILKPPTHQQKYCSAIKGLK